MSIETEFESTITNVKNAYQGLDNLGATIPQNKTIENIESCLSEIYSNLPKTDYSEGSNITLSNTLKGKLDFEDGIVGIGDTSQKSYEGYNLAKIEDTNRFIMTDNNYIKTRNYTSGQYYTKLNIAAGETIYLFYRQAKRPSTSTSFILSNGGGDIAASSYVNINGTALDTTYVKSYTASVNETLSIRVWGNSNNEEIIFQLWITKDNTKNTFEPYVGEEKSPSPSYPQLVKIVKGKNEFNPTLQTSTINGITCTRNDDNTFTLNGTATAQALFAIQTMTLDTNEVYTLSGTPSGGSNNNYFMAGANFADYGSGSTDKPSRANMTFSIVVQNGVTCNNLLFKPMLQKGDKATSFLPYNTLEIKERGKNQFSFANNSSKSRLGLTFNWDTSSITINGTSTNTDSVFGDGVNLKPTKVVGTYKISGYTRNDTFVQLYWKDKNGTIKYKELKNNPTITFNEGDTLYQLFFFAARNDILTFNNETFNIMLEKGDTITNFIPYEETTKQLSLGNIELAKIGTYRDYIYKNLSNGKWIKYNKIIKRTLNGTESINADNSYIASGRFNINQYTDAKYGSQATPNIMSNYYRPNFAIENGSIFVSGVSPDICIIDTRYQNNLNGFKQWLSENTPTIYYVLNTETYTEITDTTLINQLEDIYNLMSYTGTTILEVDGDLPLIIKTRALKGA